MWDRTVAVLSHIQICNFSQKWCKLSKSCLKVWQFHFFFLLLSRHLQVAQLVWASDPIEFGSAFVSIYGKASIMRFVSDPLKPGKFQSQSEHCNDRCLCSSLYMILCTKSGLFQWSAVCVTDDYIYSTAWVLRCLFNCDGESRTSRSGTGKCQVPRSFIYRFTLSI